MLVINMFFVYGYFSKFFFRHFVKIIEAVWLTGFIFIHYFVCLFNVFYLGTTNLVHCKSWNHLSAECSHINFSCSKSSWVSMEQKQDYYWEHSVTPYFAVKVCITSYLIQNFLSWYKIQTDVKFKLYVYLFYIL